MNTRVFLLLLLWVAAAVAEEEEPKCETSYWSNLVGNLDQMFWTPFLNRYSLVRYATEERPLFPNTAKLQNVPRSCTEMGISQLLDVMCIQLAAQLGWQKPCTLWARPALIASMSTLLECPRQTWASNEAVALSLNHTLQKRQHCMYATRAMQCSFLHFHWVIPQLMATLFVILLVGFTCGSACCCLFCATQKGEEF